MININRKVFVGGLAWETDEGNHLYIQTKTKESLSEYFEHECDVRVEKVSIMRDRNSGNSRGDICLRGF